MVLTGQTYFVSGATADLAAMERSNHSFIMARSDGLRLDSSGSAAAREMAAVIGLD